MLQSAVSISYDFCELLWLIQKPFFCYPLTEQMVLRNCPCSNTPARSENAAAIGTRMGGGGRGPEATSEAHDNQQGYQVPGTSSTSLYWIYWLLWFCRPKLWLWDVVCGMRNGSTLYYIAFLRCSYRTTGNMPTEQYSFQLTTWQSKKIRVACSRKEQNPRVWPVNLWPPADSLSKQDFLVVKSRSLSVKSS